MRFLKLSGLLLLLGALGFFIVSNFSASELRYQCAGNLAFSGTTQVASLVVKREQYRWWVGAWSDSDGTFWVEIPNTWAQYYPDTRESGDQIQILDSHGKLKGNFSTLSNALALEVRDGEMFQGQCGTISP